MASQPPLISAIQQASNDLRVQLAMAFGSMEEGGLYGPWGATPAGPAVGDFGHSYGPYQINLPYHPGVTPQEATDPSFATGYMVNAYRKGVAAIPDSLWKSDPAMAAEEAAVAAERPAQPYVDRVGSAQVHQTYDKAVKLLGGAGASGGGAANYSSGVYVQPSGQQPGTAQANPAGFSVPGVSALSFLNPLAGVFGATDLRDMVERGALITLGALLIIVGLIMLVKDTSAGKQGISAGKDAAMAAVVA